MASLNYTITATQAEFDGFADRLGYMTTVTTGVDGNGQPVTSPNPETRTQYLERITGEFFAKLFYAPYVEDIERAVRDTREAEKEAMRENIRGRISVNYTS